MKIAHLNNTIFLELTSVFTKTWCRAVCAVFFQTSFFVLAITVAQVYENYVF